jgi:RNA polymerase sigma-54 factor
MKMQQKLTPQQLLLMQLLQLPVTSLEQRIKEEVEKNPMLEVEGIDKEETAEWNESAEGAPDDNDADDDFHGIDIEEFFGDDDYSYRERLERDRNEEPRSFDFSEGATFTETLIEQLAMRDLDERQKAIAAEIVGSIDSSGYLGRDLQMIANDMAFRSGIEVSDKEMEQMLHVIQTLDPAGVGARNLQECLSLQLHRSPSDEPAHQLATVIVDKHFKALSKKWYDDIIEVEGCDKEMLHEALSIIQRLNPKPGWGSGDESRGSHYIIPDFIVSREGGNLTFTLNERNNPQLHISGEYSEMMKQLAGRKSLTASERETLQFIKSKSESAQWLIETLQQRQQTLASTMTAILGMQRDYFLSGNPADLKPMRLKDIAAITGYDESTISRVANQKYVQSDFGTFLMKELFSKAVATEDGDVKALQHVKETLRAIIEGEDKRRPMTDEELTQKMQEKGFTLSRRTVSKYRESLGIPVGRLRRKL